MNQPCPCPRASRRMPAAWIAALALAVVAGGCAGAPVQIGQVHATDCAAIAGAMAAAENARREAQAQEQDAWKLVLPFAVAARYASAQSARADALQRQAELGAAFDRQGCARDGH